MQVNPSIFKAYDIRGTVPDQIMPELAYALGRGVMESVLKGKRGQNVVVGHDARPSSVELEKELIRGLRDGGADVVAVGMVTTPLFYFSVNSANAAGGIMVTASHNPAKYNGFKIVKEGAIAVGLNSGLAELRDWVQRGIFPAAATESSLTDQNYLDAYVDRVTYNIKTRKFRIAADGGNGMAGHVLPKVAGRLGIEVRGLYLEPDGMFPNHESNPLKHETLRDLQKSLSEHPVDFGIAFDGDADRITFLLRDGTIVPGDIMLAFLAAAYLEREPGSTVVCAVNCSRIVKETVELHGGKAVRWKVGHTLMKEKMRETDAVLGGEISTHYFFKEMFGVESTMLVLARVCHLLTERGITLEKALAPYQKYSKTPETNFEVSDKDAKMKELSATYADSTQDWLDGLTVKYKDWWFNVRPSNTEPLLRLNLEANTQALMEQKLEEVRGIMER